MHLSSGKPVIDRADDTNQGYTSALNYTHELGVYLICPVCACHVFQGRRDDDASTTSGSATVSALGRRSPAKPLPMPAGRSSFARRHSQDVSHDAASQLLHGTRYIAEAPLVFATGLFLEGISYFLTDPTTPINHTK